MSATYVISGGTDTLVSAFGNRLRASRLLRLPDYACDYAIALADGSQCALNSAGENLVSWVHILPDASCAKPGSLSDASMSLLAVARLVDAHLPCHQGAAFTIVLPVWGTVAPSLEASVEMAAASARALMQVRIEQWSAENRRINILRYAPPVGDGFSGFRDTEALLARTPMHRQATTDEIADAIDFLASTAAAYVTGSVLDVEGGWNAYSWFYPARNL
jgi:hypothetical protein